MSLLEITLVVCTAPVLLLIRNTLFTQYPYLLNLTQHRCLYNLIEAICLVTPSLLAFTILSDYIYLMIYLSLLMYGLLIMRLISHPLARACGFSQFTLYNATHRPYLTNFRAFINILSCIGILAVDFSIFPLRFHKTEVYGTGLMDIGVGSYIGMSALVSGYVVKHEEFNRRSFLSGLQYTIKTCLIIAIIGVGRLLLLWVFSYNQPVTEYGVHWNFFLTIAVVRLIVFTITSSIPASFNPKYLCAGLGVIIAIIYQIVLSNGLMNYILKGQLEYCNDDCEDKRETLFSANREGILSCTGYVSIYLISASIGFVLHNRNNVPVRSVVTRLLPLLFMITVFMWGGTLFSSELWQPMSRRAANLSYCLWIIAVQTTFIIIFIIVDITTAYQAQIINCKRDYISARAPSYSSYSLYLFQPVILTAVNRYQLIYFLAANLLTGLVNVIIGDHPVWKSIALCILVLYQGILLSISLSMYVVRNKFTRAE